MALPTRESPIWEEIIKGKKVLSFEFFAAKIFLGSAQVCFTRDPSSLPKLAADLHILFEKNQNLPSAKKDLEKLSSHGEKK